MCSANNHETTMTESKKRIAYKPIINYDDYAGGNPISTTAIVMEEDDIFPVLHGEEKRLKELTEEYDEIGLIPYPTPEEACEVLDDFDPDSDNVEDDETLNLILDEEGSEGTEARLDVLVEAAIAAGFEIVERDFTKDAIKRDERDAQAKGTK